MDMTAKQACEIVHLVGNIMAQPPDTKPYPRRLLDGLTLSQVNDAFLIATAQQFYRLSRGEIDLENYKKFKDSLSFIEGGLLQFFIRNEDWDKLNGMTKSSEEYLSLFLQSSHIEKSKMNQEELDFNEVETLPSFAKYVESLDPSSSLYWPSVYRRVRNV
jgi:hypothetical protein